MAPRPIARPYAAALKAGGFRQHVVSGGTAGEIDVYRRPAEGRWSLEARQDEGTVDIGLTVDAGGGLLIGPIHRALSPSALASALPHIVESLSALAATAESLRCPRCNSWAVMRDSAEGPYLACGQARAARRPLERTVRRCRRSLAMTALIVYGEHGPTWRSG
jgi:hypothetical protein